MYLESDQLLQKDNVVGNYAWVAIIYPVYQVTSVQFMVTCCHICKFVAVLTLWRNPYNREDGYIGRTGKLKWRETG